MNREDGDSLPKDHLNSSGQASNSRGWKRERENGGYARCVGPLPIGLDMDFYGQNP